MMFVLGFVMGTMALLLVGAMSLVVKHMKFDKRRPNRPDIETIKRLGDRDARAIPELVAWIEYLETRP